MAKCVVFFYQPQDGHKLWPVVQFSCSCRGEEGRLTELGAVIVAQRLSSGRNLDEVIADHDGVELQAFGLVDRTNDEV